ncbi:hypothetical protein CVV38_00055 [Candidatus Peregrinibacteria bacterium HGW-Peregrinibacteria-1]|nr:MAG: hypothetical protein CVV38_00055 [Candidatus Peregrinibacteria bacterium HGW-Peregrinibacteria-1]
MALDKKGEVSDEIEVSGAVVAESPDGVSVLSDEERAGIERSLQYLAEMNAMQAERILSDEQGIDERGVSRAGRMHRITSIDMDQNERSYMIEGKYGACPPWGTG